MSLSVKREWTTWVHEQLNKRQTALKQFYAASAAPLNFASSNPNPIRPTPPLTRIDTTGLGDISGLPAIGSIKPSGTVITSQMIAQIVRPADLLVVGLSFSNLSLVYSPSGTATISQLISIDSTRPSYIQLRLPAQSIGEDTFAEPGTELPVPTRARASGMSNLYFRLPNNFVAVPYSLHGVLDALRTSSMEVREQLSVPLSSNDFADKFEYLPSVDFSLFSWLEIPYRIILAPSQGMHWNFSSKSVRDGTRTELWHARFGVATGNPAQPADEGGAATARAIWSPDLLTFAPVPPRPDDVYTLPTTLATNTNIRQQLVLLSSDPKVSGNPPQITLERLTISALGAWLTAQWDYPDPDGLKKLINPLTQKADFSLSEWVRRMTMGRDQFVRIVNEGYLYPFGHRVALVTITERKLKPVSSGEPDVVGTTAASLRTREFIIVRQPDRDYTNRAMPFRHLHLKTTVTPNLVGATGKWFWIQVESAPDSATNPLDFRFTFVGTDWQQNTLEFTAPALYVDFQVTNYTLPMSAYNSDNGTDGRPRRRTPLAGQRIAFAPGADATDLRTTLTSDTFDFKATNLVDGDVPFRSEMGQADVYIPAIEALKGERLSTSIQLHPSFTSASSGIGNAADVFAEVVVGSSPSLSVTKEQAGGLIAPAMAIQGLSREFGPVNTVSDLVGTSGGTGTFKPGNYLPKVSILGGITLESLFSPLQFDSVDALKFPGASVPGAMMPGLTTSIEGNTRITRFTWHVRQDTQTVSGQPFITTALFTPNDNTEFSIATTITQPVSGGTPTVESVGTLSNFMITLIPGFEAVNITFQSITFTSRTGSKVDVTVKLGDFQFVNELRFVQQLMEVVPLDGFDDPPYLELVDGGLCLGYTLAIPTIGMGVFTLQNLSLSAGFYLPITASDSMSLQLALARREAPCILTVSLFGGGAFFAIAVGLNGLQSLEAALEFGAAIAISLGVAAGGVTVMGGVYFSLKTDSGNNVVSFTAYIRINGELEVLGLISVSVEFYLGMTYNASTKKLEGDAQMTVKIKIVFFSKKVSISVHRELAGSDPTFIDTVTLTDWDSYLAAFASA